MKQTLKLWALGAFMVYAIRFIPFPLLHSTPFAAFLLWCLIVRFSRRFFFASFSHAHLARIVKEKKGATLITGASSGIGRAAAQILMRANHRVVLSARSVDKLHDAVDSLPTEFHANGRVLSLDLASFASIKAFARSMRDKVHSYCAHVPRRLQEEPISTLILNAAYHGPHRLTEDGVEYSIGVTHLGHMLLVHELLPVMTSDCRVVVVASDVHRLCTGVRLHDLMYARQDEYTMCGFAAYNHSKLCNVMFVGSLAEMVKATSMSIVAVHPGTPVESDLLRANSLVSMAWFQWTLRAFFFNVMARQAEHGADALLHAAFDPRVRNGEYFENLESVPPNAVARDASMCAQLWTQSCRLVGIPTEWNIREANK